MKDTLQQDFNHYIESRIYSKKLRSETIRGYKEVFRHFTSMMPDVIYADQLSASIMTQFFKKLEVRKRIVGRNTEKVGIKASTIMTYWSKLHTYFEWLLKQEKIVKNPLTKENRPPEPVYDDVVAFKQEEVDKIQSMIALHAKNTLLLRRDLAMVTLLLLTGVRKNELVSLQIRDIDMQKNVMTVRGETSKSRKTRQLPLHPLVESHLKEYLTERIRGGYKTQYLFISNNKDVGLSVHGMKHWVKRLNRLTGLNLHLHQFRHTYACNLAKTGAGSFVIQRLMGHTDLRMTQRYLRSLTVDDMRDDVNKLRIDNL